MPDLICIKPSMTISRKAKYKMNRRLVISLQLTLNLITTFSLTAAGKPLIICDFNPPIIYRPNYYFILGRIYAKYKESKYLVID